MNEPADPSGSGPLSGLRDGDDDSVDPASVRDGDVVDASSDDPGIPLQGRSGPGIFSRAGSHVSGAPASATRSSSSSKGLEPGIDTGSGESVPRHRRSSSSLSFDGSALSNPGDDESDSTAKRHQPDEEPLPEIERIFGPYTLLRRLAFGGMGEVFLGRRDANIETLGVKAPGLARLVVIKRILNHMRRDEKNRRMFLDEARLQTALRSAHIVQVHDVGEIDGQVFLAMEHVHGPSWRALIDRCRKNKQHLPVAFVVEMMIQACDGLSYAHNLVDASSSLPLRIVHRDVNPHNILVTYDGVVKVIDFGIAKSELREQQTETGTIKGKFAYMSPEQSAAEPLDARSDLFALGICLYELLTLTNPFKKGNIVLSLEAIQKTDPKPVAVVRPGAAFMGPVVERMLRKNPDDRFADCAEVAGALRQLQRDGLVPEPKQTLPIWLRELFADEIQSHMRVLETTGSDVDVGLSSSVRLKQVSPTGTPAGSPATLVPTLSQLDDHPNTEILRSEDGTGPTGALALGPRRPGLLAAAVGIGMLAFAAVFFGWRLMRSKTDPIVAVDAGVVVLAPIVLEPVPLVVDAGVVVAAVDGVGVVKGASDGGVATGVDAVVDAGVDPGVVADDDLPEADSQKVTRRPDRPRADKDKKPLVVPVVDVVGKVAVSAEGFVVKGSRTVGAKAPAVLVVDDSDAPFKLKIKVSVDESGAARLSLESEPWAIVRVDQVGKGKTPVAGVALVPGKKMQLSLQNPSGAAMDVSVTFAAKAN